MTDDVRGPAACHLKANKEVTLVERNVLRSGCWQLADGVGNTCPTAISPSYSQWARAFIDSWRELCTSTAQSARIVILKLVPSGLTSIILIVLSTVSLQYQGQFVPHFLRQILRIVAAYAMAMVWSSCSQLLPLCGSSSI